MYTLGRVLHAALHVCLGPRLNVAIAAFLMWPKNSVSVVYGEPMAALIKRGQRLWS